MGCGYRLSHLVASLAMLAALPACAQEQQPGAGMADSFAHLHGYGEGAAAAMAASLPVKRQKFASTDNGRILLKTYRQPGVELTTWSAGGQTHPMALAISRPGYPLPLGLRIGDLRGAVERMLGAPDTGGDTLVLARTQGEGCADPVTLTFRGKVLTEVTWTWQTCMD